MVKNLLILHGLSSGSNFKNGGEHLFMDRAIRALSLIAKNHQMDIIFHSWCNDEQKNIVDILKPVKYQFEDPKTFIKPNVLDLLKDLRWRLTKRGSNELLRKNNIMSRWYSFNQGLVLSEEFATDYENIIITRFDVIIKNPEMINSWNVSKGEIGLAKWYGVKLNEYEWVSDIELKNYDLSELIEVDSQNGLHDFLLVINSLDLKTFFKLMDFSKKNIQLNSNHKILDKFILTEGLEKRYLLSYPKDITISRWI